MAAPGKMTADKRDALENMWVRGYTFAEIGRVLGVHLSTVSREIGRNGSGRHGSKNPLGQRARGSYLCGYTAEVAQDKARRRRRRPKARKLAEGTPVRLRVVDLMLDRFSPQQVAASLRLEYPDRPEMWVSHETIYHSIYLQARGSLRELLKDGLRTGRQARRSQSRAAKAARGPIRGKSWVNVHTHISARPPEVEDRAVCGHHEGDLLMGIRNQSAIITIAERTTRLVMLGALPNGHSSEDVIAVIRTLFARLPARLVRSLTWDQGVELAGYATFGLIEDCPVYFCDPHSPWQRGTNENTNGLLRQYYPKGKVDFSKVSQEELDAVADQLNRRPRKTLGWQTPAQKFNELLALTP